MPDVHGEGLWVIWCRFLCVRASVSDRPQRRTPAACPPQGWAHSSGGIWADGRAEGSLQLYGWPAYSWCSYCSSTEPEHRSVPPPCPSLVLRSAWSSQERSPAAPPDTDTMVRAAYSSTLTYSILYNSPVQESQRNLSKTECEVFRFHKFTHSKLRP